LSYPAKQKQSFFVQPGTFIKTNTGLVKEPMGLSKPLNTVPGHKDSYYLIFFLSIVAEGSGILVSFTLIYNNT